MHIRGEPTMKVLAINGSPRKKGNTQLMLDAAREELEKCGIQVEGISLADFDVRPCDGCEKCTKKHWECHIKDDALALLKRMAASDGLLIGSPVYWGGVTAQLKALFDRSTIPYQTHAMKGKVGAAVCVGGGAHGGQELTVMQIATYFFMSEMIVAGSEGGLPGAMALGNAKGDVIEDAEGLKSARYVGKRMAELIKTGR
jgi:multimeric flavodoxin WrbA